MKKKNLLKPSEVYFQSNKKYWWKCPENHNYRTNLLHRTERGTGCPYCSGRYTIKGENDLTITHPELAKEWNYDKNTKTPEDFKAGSNVKVWWKCSLDHTWETTVYNRTVGKNCPYCAGNKRWIGFNNFSLLNASLLPFWDYKKNKKTPDEYGTLSSAKVWWKCDKGHSYKTSILKRKKSKTECAQCAKSFSISIAEKEIVDFLEEYYGKDSLIRNSRKVITPYEIDIYLPEKKIAIEYNGLYWHSERALSTQHKDAKNYHYNKWKLCYDKGIELIMIWEDDWEFRKDFIKKNLLKRLEHSSVRKFSADETTIKNLTKEETTSFLNLYHIQEIKTSGHIKLGLIDKNENIIAALVGRQKIQKN